MLKMGQMCHCGYTVAKWDSNGNLLWKKSRGKNGSLDRADVGIYSDFTTNELIAGGTVVADEDEGVLYKYSAIDGTSPNTDWKSDRNGLTEVQLAPTRASFGRSRILQATDGYLWALGDTMVMRYNSDGVEQASDVHTLYRGLLLGPSGCMFAEGTRIGRFDTSVTLTHSYIPVIFGSLNDTIVRDATHLCVVGQLTVGGGPWKKLAILDHTLAETATFSKAGSNQRAFRVVIEGNNAYTFETVLSTPQFVKYDLTGITETWVNTTMQSSGTGYSPVTSNQSLLALDESGNLFTVAEKSGAVSKIQKRSTADGSILWETDIGESKLDNMMCLKSHAGIVVALGRWYQGASSTDPRHIIALDASGGSVLWHDQHGNITDPTHGLFDLDIDDDANVYSCGIFA